ncbi:hypothetical protein PENTCL1PPCAC_20670, partial [Pristionchus entomophagus]
STRLSTSPYLIMRLSDPLSIAFVIFASTSARVTFPFSEVFQRVDLEYDALFNCVDGCKVYANQGPSTLQIAQYGKVITTFKDEDPINPKGIELNAGTNYSIQFIEFKAFEPLSVYVVSKKAPNYASPVFLSQEPQRIDIKIRNRFVTVLSTPYSMSYKFNGTFNPGYPKIFATGFDTISDIYRETSCTTVYQSRSQYGAEHSILTVYAPIITVDVGNFYSGNYTVTVIPNITGFNPLETTPASTVVMSSGFVGCPFVVNQTYYSDISDPIKRRFTFIARTFDIAASSNSVYPDKVELRVNQDILDFSSRGASSFTKHYGQGAYDVTLVSPSRQYGASWALQLDFGVYYPPILIADIPLLEREGVSWMIIIYISSTATILAWLWLRFN